jgi:hypothetical protein
MIGLEEEEFDESEVLNSILGIKADQPPVAQFKVETTGQAEEKKSFFFRDNLIEKSDSEYEEVLEDDELEVFEKEVAKIDVRGQ